MMRVVVAVYLVVSVGAASALAQSDRAPVATRVPRLELPDIDSAAMTPEQRELLTDLRVRFHAVSAQVQRSRLQLDRLGERLQRQGLALHPEVAADATRMERYLADAVALSRSGSFAGAIDALRRADYARVRLKGVTGQ
jgi:hypothetical protein